MTFRIAASAAAANGAPLRLSRSALLFLLVGLGLSAGSQLGAQERPAGSARPVTAAQVEVRPMPMSLAAVGTVEPIQSVSVRAQVGGVVTRVAFEPGSAVKAGQVLFQIDPRPLQATLAAAKAQLARDQAQAAHAQVQAERYERLVAKDYVTREQYDAARTQAEVLKAAVQASEAAVEQARLQLAYATITAPIAGQAGAVLVKLGNVIRANDAVLVVINQVEPIWVTFAVPGGDLPQVRRYAAEHRLAVRCRPTREANAAALEGHLIFVDNAVAPGTGTVTLKAEFGNGGGALWPGQFVDAELELTTETQALTLPAVAVVAGQDGPFVYVIDDAGKAQRRSVRVARTVNGVAVMADGVAAGERVVTDGQMWLVPGAAVSVKTARAAGAGDGR
jgi:multidrug efflux system membrane fusion protein